MPALPVRKPTPQIVKDYPALTGSAALALVVYVLGSLVTHHVIGSMQVGPLEKLLVPLVAAALTQLAGVLLHMVVSPAHKVADLIERHSNGALNDADFARLDQWLRDNVGDDLGLAAGPAEPAVHDLGDSPVPDGMAAGAPELAAPPA